MNELLDAALAYARKGWPVIPLHGRPPAGHATVCTCGRLPCSSPAKHPRTANGLKDASTDPKVIQDWWTRWPDSNVGLVTGVAFDVLDVDGPEGLASAVNSGYIPDGLTVETGGGGLHYLFKPLGAGNRARMLPGLDWRGEGGYIVAPPSVHASGRKYRKHPASSDMIPDAPAWLQELVQKPTRQPTSAAVASEWTQAAVGSSYGQRALESELAALAVAPEGTRNDQLNRSAFSLFQLVKAGVLDENEVWPELMLVAERIGLDYTETGRTLRSAWESAEARELSNPTVAIIDTKEGAVIIPGQGRRLKLTPVSELPSYKTDWLWDGRVPMGALTLVGGREGIGKSTLCYDIASDVTRGTVLGFHRGTPRNVLIVATEDDWSRTIKPRLTAAKTNLERVFQITVEAKPGAGPLELTLPHDTEALAELVKTNEVDLILLDPLLSRVDIKLDSHKDADVRTALEPVTKLASETGCAVMGIIHVNKSGTKDPLTSLMGSRAFAAVARAVLFVMVDPEDETLRLLLQAKNNLGISDIPALRYSIDNTPAGLDSATGEDIFSGKLNWRGESRLNVEMAMEMSEQTSDEKTALVEASEWLKEYLEAHGGLDDSNSIKAAARKAEISASTLGRARTKIGVGARRLGAGSVHTSVWYLPGHDPALVSSPEQSEQSTKGSKAGDLLDSSSPCLHADQSELSTIPSFTLPTYIKDNSPGDELSEAERALI